LRHDGHAIVIKRGKGGVAIDEALLAVGALTHVRTDDLAVVVDAVDLTALGSIAL
jgi:hypothetical protein